MDRSMTLLLDTNVLLDLYLPDRDSAESSIKLTAEARHRGDSLCFCAHSVVDVFYQIAATMKRYAREEKGELLQADARAAQEMAWACIDNLCEIATPVGLGAAEIWLARKYRSFNGDLEDNLVLACAERVKVDYLVTGDKRLLKKASVATLTPEDALALLDARS